MTVKLNRPYKNLFAGESAGFAPEEEEALIASGSAVDVPKPIAGASEPAKEAEPLTANTEQPAEKVEQPAEKAARSPKDKRATPAGTKG